MKIEIPVEYKSRFTAAGIQTVKKGERFPRNRARKKTEKKTENKKSKDWEKLLKRVSGFLAIELEQSDPNEYPQFCLKWCIEIMEKQDIKEISTQVNYLLAFRGSFAKFLPKYPLSEIAVFIYKNRRSEFISFVIKRKISISPKYHI